MSLLTASQSGADSIYWTGATGDWHDPPNWDIGVPTINDYAYIDNSGTAQITADAFSRYLYLGYDASGAVEQTGGTHTLYNCLSLGYATGSSGTYNLSGGELSFGCNNLYIGYDGTGEFNQTGGTNTITDTLIICNYYDLNGGELSVGQNEYLYGVFNQTGGTHTVLNEIIGYTDNIIDVPEVMELNLTGGTHFVTGTLTLGSRSGIVDEGIFSMSGGLLEVNELVIEETGTLNITDEAAVIEITGSWLLKKGSHIFDIPGLIINITDASFCNGSVSRLNTPSFADTSFVFESTTGEAMEFEVCSFDMGPVMAGFDFDVSFVIDEFVLGAEDPSILLLVDSYTNFYPDGPRTQYYESLYVRKLFIGEGSTLDLNGYHLYRLEYTNNGGTVLNGTIGVIPELGTIILLGAGLAGLAGVLRRKS